MPGWEPERLEHLTRLFEAYQNVTEEDLWSHLHYFLERIIPTAARCGIKMAIHPDDPPWPVFGLPRIMTSGESIGRLLQLVDHPANGVTLCSGSLGANPENDISAMIHAYADRIPFAHIRNVKVYENGDFIETSHRTKDGTVDICGIVKAYHETGFQAMCVRITAATFGMKSAGPATVCMTGRSVSCIYGAYGIRSIEKNRRLQNA